jgi:hypothetical protein
MYKFTRSKTRSLLIKDMVRRTCKFNIMMRGHTTEMILYFHPLTIHTALCPGAFGNTCWSFWPSGCERERERLYLAARSCLQNILGHTGFRWARSCSEVDRNCKMTVESAKQQSVELLKSKQACSLFLVSYHLEKKEGTLLMDAWSDTFWCTCCHHEIHVSTGVAELCKQPCSSEVYVVIFGQTDHLLGPAA